MFEKIMNKLGYVPSLKLQEQGELLEGIIHLENEMHSLKRKETILYMVSELLHNKDWREQFSDDELNNIFTKARLATKYYGDDNSIRSIKEQIAFTDYLNNDAWVKIFKKPAKDSDYKISEWFSEEWK